MSFRNKRRAGHEQIAAVWEQIEEELKTCSEYWRTEIGEWKLGSVTCTDDVLMTMEHIDCPRATVSSYHAVRNKRGVYLAMAET